MPSISLRMPAKKLLPFFAASLILISMIGCYTPYPSGHYNGPVYQGQQGYPGAYPQGGTIVQPGTHLGAPTPVDGSNAPPFNGGSSGSGTDNFGDGNNNFNDNDGFGRQDSFRQSNPVPNYKDPNGFDNEPDSFDNSKDNFNDSGSGFGANNEFNDTGNSFDADKDQGNNFDADKDFANPPNGPSAEDNYQTPFSEARKKQPSEFDGAPGRSNPPADDFGNEFNDNFKKDAKDNFDGDFKNDTKDNFDGGFDDDAKDTFDGENMFDQGSIQQSPTPVQPASSSRELSKQDAAKIDRFSRDQSKPNPYAYDRKNFRWLRGVVDFDEQSGSWNIIYSTKPDKNDKFGGSITLVESELFSRIHDHDIVLVEGEVDHSAEPDRLGKARFRVKKVYGPLVPRRQPPKLMAPVAN